MADLQKVVYLSSAQYQTLISNGTVTVDGVTVTYSANDLYITPLEGIPAGGTAGQYLKKNSSTDFDTSWASLSTTPTNGSSAPITSGGVYSSLLNKTNKPVLLWSQTITRGMIFNPTSITLRGIISDYDFLIFNIVNWTAPTTTSGSSIDDIKRFSVITPSNAQYIIINGVINFNNKIFIGARNVNINSSNVPNSLYFNENIGYESGVSSTSVHNDWMIPYEIYGVRTRRDSNED